MGTGASFFQQLQNADEELELMQVRQSREIVTGWAHANRQHDIGEFKACSHVSILGYSRGDGKMSCERWGSSAVSGSRAWGADINAQYPFKAPRVVACCRLGWPSKSCWIRGAVIGTEGLVLSSCPQSWSYRYFDLKSIKAKSGNFVRRFTWKTPSGCRSS